MPDKPKYDLFVSYADADRQWVNGYLLNAMDQAGVRYQSEADFRLGAPQVTEFERLIEDSKRTLVVVSPNYLADDFDEYGQVLAQSFGVDKGDWPVIPVTREDVEMPARLEMLAGLDFTNKNRPNWSAELDRLVKNVKGKAPDLNPGEPPPCPYPGMVPFTEKDRERFFGREDDAEAALQCLLDHPFLTVIGPSGSGKSSLVFAGLIPALRESKSFGTGTWLVKSMRPGETPLLTLTSTLRADPAQPQETVAAALKSKRGAKRLFLVIDQFEESFTVANTEEVTPFHRALGELAKVPGCYVVLTVRADFYSELMTSFLWTEISDHRLEVLPLGEHGLREAITRPAEEANTKVYVEGALVERLVTDAAGEPGVLPLMQETLRLLWTRLDRRFLSLGAYEALAEPKSSRGTGGAPPRTGLQVAMVRRADSALRALSVEQRTIARRIFLRLIQFGEGRADTRRQQPEAALRAAGEDPGLFDATLHHLVDARLLTVTAEHDSRPANGAVAEPIRQVDIAHEALISGWPQLQEWLAERREAEQTRRRLEAKTEEWVRLGRGQGGLLDAAELPEAERWLEGMDATELGLSEALLALVGASRAAIEVVERKQEESRLRELDLAEAARREAEQRVAEQAIAARSLRRRLMIAVSLGALALLAAIGAFWGFRQAEEQRTVAVAAAGTAEAESTRADAARVEAEGERRRAEEQAQVNLIQALAAEAVNHLKPGENELGALLARQAFLLDQDTEAPSRRPVDAALRQTLSVPWFSRDLPGHLQKVASVAFSPLGDQLASADEDGVIYLWNLPEPSTEPVFLADLASQVQALAWSPAGDWLAAADVKGTITLWKLAQPGTKPRELMSDGIGINALAFISDTVLATGNAAGFIRYWDFDKPELEPKPLVGHDGAVRALDFSPGDNRLASAGEDGRVFLWDPSKPDVPAAVLGRQRSPVLSLAFMASGEQLAAGGRDGTIEVWDLNHPGTLLATQNDDEGEVRDLAYAASGKWLVSAGAAGTVRLWNTKDFGAQPRTLDTVPNQPGGEFSGLIRDPPPVRSLAFAPDRDLLAIAGDRRIIQVWNLDTVGAYPRIVNETEEAETVEAVAFAPAENALATGSSGGTVQLWDLERIDQEPRTLDAGAIGEDAGWVHGIAWSHTGSHVATAGSDGTVWLWNLESRDQEPSLLKRTVVPSWSVAFSATGDWLAAGNEDGTVSLWHPDRPPDHSNEPSKVLDESDRRVNAVAFAPEGNLLASAGADGTIRLWNGDAPDAEQIELGSHEKQVQSLSFSPAGDVLASGGFDGTIKLWNPHQPNAGPSTLQDDTSAVVSLAFDMSGNWLASGSLDGTIRLWDVRDPYVQSAPIVLGVLGNGTEPTSVSFAPDGQMLASGGTDPFVRLWALDTNVLAEFVCQRTTRNLTEEEWRRYVPGFPYSATCPDLPSP